jgi:hypothetical protein
MGHPNLPPFQGGAFFGDIPRVETHRLRAIAPSGHKSFQIYLGAIPPCVPSEASQFRSLSDGPDRH